MSEIKALVEGSQSFAVVVGKEATFDHWVVATSLMKVLQSLEKTVVLASPIVPNLTKRPELQPLLGLEAVVDHLGKQNLIVSFDYTPDSVEAVSYAIDEQSQRFLLTIKPKPGAQPLAGDSLKTSYAGSAVEVIFLIGVHSFDQLGGVYLNNQGVFASAVKVSLHQFVPELAQISFTTQQQTCMAEFLPEILTEMGAQLTPEAASNLLYGIEQQTNWLSSLRTTAETFAVVSALLKAGAKRQPRPSLVPKKATKSVPNKEKL
jgi:hypothetical protein